MGAVLPTGAGLCPLRKPLQPQLNATRMVHVEQTCRRSANRSHPDFPLREIKMVGPHVRPGIEDIDLLTCLRVDAREIWTLEGVASCGIRQYSHRSRALRRTRTCVAASIYEEQRARKRRAFD